MASAWKWVLRGGLVIAGAPGLSGCTSGNNGGAGGGGGSGGAGGGFNCGSPPVLVAWNGNLPDGGRHDGGGIDSNDCLTLCGNSALYFCELADAGLLSCRVACVGGRAPPGLQALSTVDGSAGSWVARIAELETAAVQAFALLADELDVHGLHPQAQQARQAALDEVRHADAVTRLALRLGHCPAPLRMSTAPEPRSLEEIAIDNAGEGCGRELFGAVVNDWQATHATDAAVRSVMGSIAGDERAHAEYSFALAQTLESRLTRAQRLRAREAQERTLAHLGADEVPGRLRTTLGLMDAEQSAATSRRLLDSSRL